MRKLFEMIIAMVISIFIGMMVETAIILTTELWVELSILLISGVLMLVIYACIRDIFDDTKPISK